MGQTGHEKENTPLNPLSQAKCTGKPHHAQLHHQHLTTYTRPRHEQDTTKCKPSHPDPNSHNHIPALIFYSNRKTMERTSRTRETSNMSRLQKLAQTTAFYSKTSPLLFTWHKSTEHTPHQTEKRYVPSKRTHVSNSESTIPSMSLCASRRKHNAFHPFMSKIRAPQKRII